MANIEQDNAEKILLDQLGKEISNESVKDEYAKAFSMFEEIAAAVVDNKPLMKAKRLEMQQLKD
jgi:hypothetical protein